MEDGAAAVHCAKLDHRGSSRCIFHCRYAELAAAALHGCPVDPKSLHKQ